MSEQSILRMTGNIERRKDLSLRFFFTKLPFPFPFGITNDICNYLCIELFEQLSNSYLDKENMKEMT